MYVPKHFQESEWLEIRKVIEENSLATVVSCEAGVPVATHVPLRLVELAAGKFVLQGHFARNNPHWRVLESGEKTLVIFTGADSYISPRWYESTNVPTWNYMSVHIYGKPRLVWDAGELHQMMKGLVDRYEGNVDEAQRYRMENLPAVYRENQLRAIVGFEISVDEVQCSFKLSQNRNERDHENVIEELKKTGNTDARAIASAMRAQRKREKSGG
jgi:transcriptional regulator